MCATSSMDVKKKIGKLICAARVDAGRSQSDLAKHLGLSTSTVSRIESGEFSLHADRLFKIALWLNVEPIDLLPALTAESSALYYDLWIQ